MCIHENKHIHFSLTTSELVATSELEARFLHSEFNSPECEFYDSRNFHLYICIFTDVLPASPVLSGFIENMYSFSMY